MDIKQEIQKIEAVVKAFEKNAKDYIVVSINKALEADENIRVEITDTHIIITDYLDGEQVDYLVYIEDEVTNIEATKQGYSIGYLEHDNETYVKYRQIIKPIEDVYRTYFSWDGQEFVTNLRK
jgi:hypothetical protein